MKSKGLFFNKVVDKNQEKYLTTNTKTGIFSPAFTSWQNIKRRCFSNKFHEDFPTYKDYKESLIRKLTEIFKEQLPHNVYNILINFKVSDYE
jgi:hypothetical protein